jgi:hypothetical protein
VFSSVEAGVGHDHYACLTLSMAHSTAVCCGCVPARQGVGGVQPIGAIMQA